MEQTEIPELMAQCLSLAHLHLLLEEMGVAVGQTRQLVEAAQRANAQCLEVALAQTQASRLPLAHHQIPKWVAVVAELAEG